MNFIRVTDEEGCNIITKEEEKNSNQKILLYSVTAKKTQVLMKVLKVETRSQLFKILVDKEFESLRKEFYE